ncbi:Unknown protein sequence [Pseudomonas syringae pv. aceris]|nr:Unknown protein sequence [Pseudomonas syringae pv. aceris]
MRCLFPKRITTDFFRCHPALHRELGAHADGKWLNSSPCADTARQPMPDIDGLIRVAGGRAC